MKSRGSSLNDQLAFYLPGMIHDSLSSDLKDQPSDQKNQQHNHNPSKQKNNPNNQKNHSSIQKRHQSFPITDARGLDNRTWLIHKLNCRLLEKEVIKRVAVILMNQIGIGKSVVSLKESKLGNRTVTRFAPLRVATASLEDLRKFIRYGLQSKNEAFITLPFTAFCSNRPSTIDFVDYLLDFRRIFQVDPEVIITVLINLDRYFKYQKKDWLHNYNIYQLLAVSMLVTIKTLNDFVPNNNAFSAWSDIPTTKLNYLEAEFLNLIDHKTFCAAGDRTEYVHFLDAIMNNETQFGLLNCYRKDVRHLTQIRQTVTVTFASINQSLRMRMTIYLIDLIFDYYQYPNLTLMDKNGFFKRIEADDQKIERLEKIFYEDDSDRSTITWNDSAP